jgi:hypothetical protein
MVDCAQVAAIDTVEDYVDDLWFTLHHSEDDGDVVLGLSWYLDDSGSDDGSLLVTCGGLAMDRINFKHFSRRWAELFENYKHKFAGYTLEQPLHMSDFTGAGQYAGLRPEFKRTLFIDVARIINDHKLYSLSIAISQIEYQSELSEDIRRQLMGPYGFAFFSLVLAHQTLSTKQSGGPVKAAYLVDRGFGHQYQLNQAHKLIVDFEIALGGERHTGSLAVDADDDVPPLQAADAVAWASRKTQLQGALPEGFEPLANVLREDGERPHKTIAIPLDGIRMFSVPVNNWVARHGTTPTLRDIMTRRVDGVEYKLKP